MSRYNSKKVENVKVMLKAGADGVGIQSIEKTSTQGIVDTYTITFTNGTKTTIQITNGNGIESITKTSTQGKVDTYTITFTDGTTTTFQVTNGADTNASIAEKVTSPATKPYRIGDYVVFNDSLCEVSAPIDIDDDFEIGTNLATTTVMSEVEARSSQIFNTTGMLNRNMLSPDRLDVALENVSVGEVGSIEYGYGGYNSFIAKVEPYTDYIVSCADEILITRIILGLTDSIPEEDGTFVCAVNESAEREATFNSGNHEWVIFYMNAGYGRNPISSLCPMLKLATDLDPTYEPPTKNISELLKDLGQAQSDMIKNAVGWYGKNLLPLNINTLKTLNGSDSYWTWSNNEASTDGIILDFSVDENDMVTAIRLVRSGIYEQGYRSFKLIDNLSDYLVNGEEYILSGSEGGSYSSYGIYNGTRGTWESYEGESEPTVYRNTWDELLIDIAPVLIDETFLYPMIRNASVNDSTFEVYHKSIKDYLGTASTKNSTSVVTDSTDLVESGAVYDVIGWGNKNLLNIFETVNSVVSGLTINSDGSVTVNRSTTVITDFVIGDTTNGRLSLSDYPSDAIVSKGSNISSDDLFLQIWFYDANKTFITNQVEANGEVKLSPPSNAVYFAINFRIPADKTVNTVLHPMISIDGGAYEPYHASVEESKCDNSVIATVENGSTASQAYAVGEHFIRDGAFCTVTTAISSGESLVGSNKFTSGDAADSLQAIDVTSEFTFANDITFVTTSGWTKIYKVGNIIKGYLRFTTPSTVSIDKVVVTIPIKYLPRTSGMYFSTLVEAWTGVTCGLLANGANAITLISDTWEASKSVVANFEYVI